VEYTTRRAAAGFKNTKIAAVSARFDETGPGVHDMRSIDHVNEGAT
jgi:hypothetical protein